MITPGKLRTPMMLRKPGATTRDSSGAPTRTYTDACLVWVEVLDQGGSEFMAARQVNQRTTEVFKTYYIAEVDATWQGVIDDVTYNFTSKINVKHMNEAMIIGAEVAG